MATRSDEARIEPELVSTAQVARLLGFSESLVFQMIRTGRWGPKPIRVGRKVSYLRAEVLAWARAGADTGTLPNRARWEEMRTDAVAAADGRFA